MMKSIPFDIIRNEEAYIENAFNGVQTKKLLTKHI